MPNSKEYGNLSLNYPCDPFLSGAMLELQLPLVLQFLSSCLAKEVPTAHTLTLKMLLYIDLKNRRGYKGNKHTWKIFLHFFSSKKIFATSWLLSPYIEALWKKLLSSSKSTQKKKEQKNFLPKRKSFTFRGGGRASEVRKCSDSKELYYTDDNKLIRCITLTVHVTSLFQREFSIILNI